MEQLVENLRTAYGQSIEELDWMSPATKAQAQAKLAKFRPKIGYPDKWKDYSAIAIRADDLVGNLQRARAFEYADNLARLGKPVDRDEWHMSPQTVNAYYNPSNNEIVFPAAILQPPFFDMTADDAVNYGAIGGVIGHEMGHGFDDQGAKSDGDGVMRDWWTPQDLKEFRFRTSRLVAQYNRFEPIKGQFVNGQFTLGRTSAIWAASPSPTRPTCCRWMARRPRCWTASPANSASSSAGPRYGKACIAPS